MEAKTRALPVVRRLMTTVCGTNQAAPSKWPACTQSYGVRQQMLCRALDLTQIPALAILTACIFTLSEPP